MVMKDMLRHGAFVLVAAGPLLAGCAGDGCEYLVYEEQPTSAPPLVLPEGVPAPAESGQFRVPPGAAVTPSDRCVARPPMTLPPEVLETEEQAEEGAGTPEAEPAVDADSTAEGA